MLGYLPEGAPSYGEMSPKSFLSFIAAIRDLAGAERRRAVEKAMATCGLEPVAEQTIETLSKGYKRRVGLAQAILHDPPVLILDEPTDGLDPNQKHQVRTAIREMAKEKAIIVSTHILEEVDAVCTRAVIIDRGRIVADGTAEALKLELPYHNAIILTVAEAQSKAAASALGKLSAIATVEPVETKGELVVLRAYPRNGEPAVAPVAACLEEAGIPVRGLSVEEGRLDDVFRKLTTPDAERPHA